MGNKRTDRDGTVPGSRSTCTELHAWQNRAQGSMSRSGHQDSERVMPPAAGRRARCLRGRAPESEPPRLVARHKRQPKGAPAAGNGRLCLLGLPQPRSDRPSGHVPQKDCAICRPGSRLVLSGAAWDVNTWINRQKTRSYRAGGVRQLAGVTKASQRGGCSSTGRWACRQAGEHATDRQAAAAAAAAAAPT